MIRLIQRRLIIPRGDTGSFTVPLITEAFSSSDVAIFTIFDCLSHSKILEKKITTNNDELVINFTHNDTVNLPSGKYVWDIKFYKDPVFIEEKLIDGKEVDSYYAGYTLPVCEIRETGDNLLVSSEGPSAKLAPAELQIISKVTSMIQDVIVRINELDAEHIAHKVSNPTVNNFAALNSIGDLIDSGHNHNDYISQQDISEWAKAPEKPIYTYQEVGALPANTFIPDKTSDLLNDAGYLTQHQDISGKANLGDLAAVATSGEYSDLINKPTIPTHVSQLINDRNYLTGENDPTVPEWAKQENKPTYTAEEVGAATISDVNNLITNAIGNINSFNIEVRLSLPTENISTHTIYFIPKSIETNNIFNEYMYINNQWEMIGNTEIDLSNYTTLQDVFDTFFQIYRVRIGNPIELGSSISNWPYKKFILRLDGDPSDVIGFTNASVTISPSSDMQKGTTYNISFDRMYQGQIDFVNKTLTVTKAIVALGEMGWNIHNTAIENKHYYSTQALYSLIDYNEGIICSNYNILTREQLAANENGIAFSGSSQYIYVYDDEYAEMTVDEFKAATTEIYIAYTLRTPRVIQLALPDIKTLSSDKIYIEAEEGTLEVKYASSLENYITEQIISHQPQQVQVPDIQINNESIVFDNIANIPVADIENYGVVRINASQGVGLDYDGTLKIESSSELECKDSTNEYKPIVPAVQYAATFYGLSEAAGDSTQILSNNAVGTYTETAKSKINDMLNAPVIVSGNTPSIRAMSGVRYICGECSTLNITVPASGIVDIVFKSGSTPTVLNIESAKSGVTAIKWAGIFDPTNLDANATYEINIMDGEYGVVGKWI